MSYGLVEQGETLKCGGKYWKIKSRSKYHAFLKKAKARVERMRAKRDPECMPQYRKFAGWEY